mmetsp:Transcript_73911/g.196932  ORF Transcript_73911/g.196932 Transcript_73911/m.196932 type:complete len:547 (+) Transcript_73911:1112-2752(+)
MNSADKTILYCLLRRQDEFARLKVKLLKQEAHFLTLKSRSGQGAYLEQAPGSRAALCAILARFLCALRCNSEANGVIDTGMSGALLQNLSLFELNLMSSVKFVCRDEYKTVLNEMMENFKDGRTSVSHAIVTGTAGIGMSAFRYYIIRQWLRGELQVDWKRVYINIKANQFYCISRDGSVVCATPEPFDPDAAALVEPCNLVASKPLGFKNIVVTTSASHLADQTNKVNLSEFAKFALVYVLGLWTIDEFKKLGVDVSDDRIEQFSREVDGVRVCVPRWLLWSVRMDHHKIAEKVVASCSPSSRKALFDFFVTNFREHLGCDPTLPYRLLLICKPNTRGTQSWYVNGFLSDFVQGKVLEWAMLGAKIEQEHFLGMLQNPYCMGAVGQIFETWAFQSLGNNNKKLITRAEDFSFRALGTFKFSAVKRLGDCRELAMEDGVVYQATGGHCPSIDGFGLVGNVLLLMQMTVGRTHRAAEWVHIQHLVNAAKSRVDLTVRCVLVYVVDRSLDFQVPTCTSLEGNVEVVVGCVDECFLSLLQDKAEARVDV